eukprot:CAMPEP_0113710996 /NCGR_PEP_ID=MMETSP0038_2-20120614/30488_1 /TAXON_ID=2898 /ORGANISM="Cryptomonas paramecium" /LENGTH=447 /DNA_ID=CAMNT_0000637157 /DNA_START=273 /DNA_END=1613 /DNA_ORIENTATION=+ /assembly_acc=CAM_ASM_000170
MSKQNRPVFRVLCTATPDKGNKEDENGKEAETNRMSSDSNLNFVQIPSAVSEKMLRELWLDLRLKDAILSQNFSLASDLKAQIEMYRSQDMDELEAKLLSKAAELRKSIEVKRRDLRGRLVLELESAIVEEDYLKAAQLAQQINATSYAPILSKAIENSTRTPSIANSIGRRLEMAWMENEIRSKVAFMRLREEAFLRQDPVEYFRRRMNFASKQEDYEEAASARDGMVEWDRKISVEKMYTELPRLLAVHRANLQRIEREDPIRFLEMKLSDLVNSEQYEDAVSVRDELKQAKLDRLIDTINREVRLRERTFRFEEELRRRLAGPEEELEEALREEDYARAARLRDQVIRRAGEGSGAYIAGRLESILARAVGMERFRSASRIKRRLLDIYSTLLSKPILRALGFKTEEAAEPAADGGGLFRLGDVVVHKALGYRGVVVGWDVGCR